jgi:hypothetical protein
LVAEAHALTGTWTTAMTTINSFGFLASTGSSGPAMNHPRRSSVLLTTDGWSVDLAHDPQGRYGKDEVETSNHRR